MSDILWAAIIAVAGSSITGAIAYFASIRTASEQTRRERARLRDEHRESDRRARRDVYVQYLACVERLDATISMYARPVEREQWETWLYDFRAAQVAVRVVESPAVRDARRELGGMLEQLAPEVERRADAGQPMQDALGIPYMEMRSRLAKAGGRLGDAMRDDLAFADDLQDAAPPPSSLTGRAG
jgi:hypothetical protein